MSNEISKLFVVIGAKTDEFKTGLDKMKEQASGWSKQMGAIGGVAKEIFPMVGVGAGVYEFRKMMVTSAEYGDEIGLAAEKTKLSTDFIQKLNLAAAGSGTTLSGVTTNIRNLNNIMADAFAGKPAAIEFFDQIGVSVEELQKSNAEGRINLVFEAISKIEDPAIKSKAAVKAFGQTGADLIPLIDNWGELNKQHMTFLSKEDIQTLRDGKAAMQELDSQWQILQGRFAVAAWPAITPLLDLLNQALTLFGQIADKWNSIDPKLRMLMTGGMDVWSSGAAISSVQKSFISPAAVATPQLNSSEPVTMNTLGAGNQEIHTHVYLNGREIAEAVNLDLYHEASGGKGWL